MKLADTATFTYRCRLKLSPEQERIACLTSGLTADRAKARIGDAVTAIAVWAQARAKPIVIEKLDFARKKAETESRQACPGRRSGGGRRCNRRLSGFAYAKIGAGLHSAAFPARY